MREMKQNRRAAVFAHSPHSRYLIIMKRDDLPRSERRAYNDRTWAHLKQLGFTPERDRASGGARRTVRFRRLSDVAILLAVVAGRGHQYEWDRPGVLPGRI